MEYIEMILDVIMQLFEYLSPYIGDFDISGLTDLLG